MEGAESSARVDFGRGSECDKIHGIRTNGSKYNSWRMVVKRNVGLIVCILFADSTKLCLLPGDAPLCWGWMLEVVDCFYTCVSLTIIAESKC